jgi:energy-coupling factor transport system ATP-binding protein
MIRLEGVAYRYAGMGRPSLSDVDLELADGEVVGLVGPSEAGKTTLCLVLSGLAPRAIRGTLSGRMLIEGEDVRGWPMHRLTEAVGIGFQNPTTQLTGVTDTVYEEVAFGASSLGLSRAQLVDRVDVALDRLRIGGLAARDPSTLSGGQMQLVAIAGLLAMGPRHLVLDEPTAQLDPEGTRLVLDAIVELAGDGASILVVEHKVDELARVCSRVVVVDAGRIAADGPTDRVLADSATTARGVDELSEVRVARLAHDAGVHGAAIDAAVAAIHAPRSRGVAPAG